MKSEDIMVQTFEVHLQAVRRNTAYEGPEGGRSPPCSFFFLGKMDVYD